MRILFIATANSIHTARWINQLQSEKWDIYIFPVIDRLNIHDDLCSYEICLPFYKIFKKFNQKSARRYTNQLYRVISFLNKSFDANYYQKRLSKYVKKLKPDIIHSLETQGAGYLVSDVKKSYFQQIPFPFWWHTLWGSDIFLFGRLAAHKGKIQEVITLCDGYSTDCKRDDYLLEHLGFSEKKLPVSHATSGFKMDAIRAIRDLNPEKPSERRMIMLKGYQGWSGRSLVAIRALSRCADILKPYTLVVYSNVDQDDLKIALELFSNEAGVKIVFIPDKTSHSVILGYHAKARISIGLGISDGVPNSLLEAMSVGSFPIQSFTSAADEWIENGVTGFLVPPEDPEVVELAIRKAIADDLLVNKAAETNFSVIQQKAEYNSLAFVACETYRNIFNRL